MDGTGQPDVTLRTLHEDLGAVRGDLGATLRAVRETNVIARENLLVARENTQLLRESNRISEDRFTRLDTTLREQAMETHSLLRAVLAAIRALPRGGGNGAPA